MAAYELISVEFVRDRLSLDDTDAVTLAVQKAIDLAVIRLESVLDTKFANGEYTDIFLVTPKKPSVDGYFRLRLSNGFVDKDAGLSIVYADDVAGLASGTTHSVVDGEVDWERGVVGVPLSLSDKYIKISYSAGFFDDASCVPDWVKEGCFYKTYEALTLNQSNDIKTGLERSMKMMNKIGSDVLDSHLRFNRNLIRPIV